MISVDTTNILFVVGGAFVGLDEIIRKRLNLNTSKIGFGDVVTEKDIEQSLERVEPR